MANIRGIVGQSTRLASRDGYGGHINFFHYWSDDTQAQCEVPGYLTRRQMPSNYVDGDVIYIFGDGFNQTYTGVTNAATLEITLTAVHGAGSGTVLGDGNISNIQLVGTNLVFTGNAGAFNGTISLAGILPTTYMRAINTIDLKPTGLPNQYTVSMTWTDQNGAVQTTNDTTPVTISFTETVTTMSDQGNGTYVYTSENGTTTLIAPTGVVTTMVDNGNGTFTYTNEAGLAVTIAAGAETVTTMVDQGNKTYVYTSENATSTLIDARGVNTTLVDNNNASFTYTNELGVPVTYTEEVTTLVDAGNGNYTYTNEAGVAVPFGWVRAVNVANQLPNPTSVKAGMLWIVNNDTVTANGIYKVDGAIGGNGVGYTQI